MAKNKYLGLAFIALAMVLVVGVVSATTTINTPIAAGNYSGTVSINVTTDLANTDNVTCYYDADGGEVNSSSSELTTIQNDTDGDTEFTATVDVSSFSDKETYNVTCIATNTTGSTEEATNVAGITIDNTAPTVTLRVLLDGDRTSYGSLLRHKCTISDSLDSSPTESYAVSHPSGDTTSSTTLETGTSDFVSFTDTDYSGDYVFSCTGTDYTGNTGYGTATVTVNDAGNLIVKEDDQGFDLTGGNNLVLLLIVGLIVFFLVKKK